MKVDYTKPKVLTLNWDQMIVGKVYRAAAHVPGNEFIRTPNGLTFLKSGNHYPAVPADMAADYTEINARVVIDL